MIRAYRPEDRAACYDVCLKAGDSGKDATHLFQNKDLLGLRYVGPYLTLNPELCFVLEDEEGVCGYCLGCLDSLPFYERMQKEYLVPLQQQYPCPPEQPPPTQYDAFYIWAIHHAEADLHIPERVAEFPSHLHIDLRERVQRKGYGRKMMDVLMAALKARGSSGVHLEMQAANENAFQFYTKLGFVKIGQTPNAAVIYMGKTLD
jgi:ribosomal protein S18 acetylase RimI-like enzyme